MTPELILLLVGVIFLFVLFCGHPLSFTLGGLAVIFGATVWGNVSALNLFIRTTTSIGTNIVYTAVPMFIFMGVMLERSGAADDLFDSMYIIFGPLRGGSPLPRLSSALCWRQRAASSAPPSP